MLKNEKHMAIYLEGKRTLGRSKHRWEVNIKINLRKYNLTQNMDKWLAIVNRITHSGFP